jgi:hypothetical protein
LNGVSLGEKRAVYGLKRGKPFRMGWLKPVQGSGCSRCLNHGSHARGDTASNPSSAVPAVNREQDACEDDKIRPEEIRDRDDR